MRFVGIDIASERHVVASRRRRRATVHAKADAVHRRRRGYQQAARAARRASRRAGRHGGDRPLLEEPVRGTGRRRALPSRCINPLRTRRFAEEDLARTKTDAIDALGHRPLRRRRSGPRPRPCRMPPPRSCASWCACATGCCRISATACGSCIGWSISAFPSSPATCAPLDSDSPPRILRDYPTAAAFRGASERGSPRLRYDGRHHVGLELARALIDAARSSVGQHHSAAYRPPGALRLRRPRPPAPPPARSRPRHRRQAARARGRPPAHHHRRHRPPDRCPLDRRTRRPRPRFAAPARWPPMSAPSPPCKQSGKRRPAIAPASRRIGNAQLRAALWMPTLTAVRCNPWLRAHYQRLRARGKLPKVALWPPCANCSSPSTRWPSTAVHSFQLSRQPHHEKTLDAT